MPDKIRIVVVDDHQVIRSSWKLLFETDARFVVSGVFKSGPEVIGAAALEAPDVILMDINMNPMNGFETTEILLNKNPNLRIIGVSANSYPAYADKIMKIGARGFVTKSSPFEELTTAVYKVHQGEEYVCAEIREQSGG